MACAWHAGTQVTLDILVDNKMLLLIEFTSALHIYALKEARATRARNIAPLALAASQ
jgi:hypothetical protein